MIPSKTFCQIPWLHRYTNEQGWHMLCCVGEGEANFLHNAAGHALHVNQGLTDAQVLNSPDLKQIRLAMLQGAWPAACERCRQMEEAGGTSSRNYFNNRYSHWIEDSFDQTTADGTLTRPAVRYADLRLGNVCNLTCRMCGPGESRLWADHFVQVQPKEYQLPAEALNAARNDNWVKNGHLEWLLRECLPCVEGFNFGGGEPLIIPEMVDLLEYCIASGRAPEIDLAYNTNITALPDKVTRLWPKFRSTSLVCSIDGFGPLNEYIRRPSKWRDIDRNLRLLEQHAEEWKLKPIAVSTTLQIYNVLQIGDLVDYLSSANFTRIAPVPQLVPLYQPRYLCIQILPDEIKAMARERLAEARRKAEALRRPDVEALISTFDAAIAYMDQGNGSRRDLMNFRVFSEKSDREFGDSWRQTCPELAEMLLGQPT
jgi:MoaA/NifB/PqqE/SkfB family radical SAM enzyme